VASFGGRIKGCDIGLKGIRKRNGITFRMASGIAFKGIDILKGNRILTLIVKR